MIRKLLAYFGLMEPILTPENPQQGGGGKTIFIITIILYIIIPILLYLTI